MSKALVSFIEDHNEVASENSLEHRVHDRPDATAFGAVAHRRVGFIERVLPNHAQQQGLTASHIAAASAASFLPRFPLMR